jgi:ABC-2 type transport system ATP-binding protein
VHVAAIVLVSKTYDGKQAMTNSPPNAVVKMRGVSKAYSDKRVLEPIDLDIYAGQVVGYLGPNGAGKTTTIKILTGITEEFEGSAEVCGFDVRKEPLEVKKRIGYVPEVATLYDSLSALEYLLFVGRVHHMGDALIESRASEMLSLLGLEAERQAPMYNFSKGMKQKVLFTAGVIHNPSVLFLDEPLSGLDVNAMMFLKELIAQLARAGKAIFYTSHIMDVVQNVCDRIVILDKGKVLADGSFAELQEQQGKNQSLEDIFSKLTSNVDHVAMATRFMRSLGSGAPGS